MFSSAIRNQKHQEPHQPTWKWDVHADGVIFSYDTVYPSPVKPQQPQPLNRQETRPTLLDYFHLSPSLQVPGDL